jgi:hypothetical protein
MLLSLARRIDGCGKGSLRAAWSQAGASASSCPIKPPVGWVGVDKVLSGLDRLILQVDFGTFWKEIASFCVVLEVLDFPPEWT